MIFPLKKLNDHFQSYDLKSGLISIWGEYGVGKTTLSLQTALYNSSLGNMVIYIYTKPNFPLKKIKNLSQKFNEKLMDNLILYRIVKFSELFDFILYLEQIIINVKNREKKTNFMVIIDSLTNLYRIELRKDSKDKNVILNYTLNQILATLAYLSANYAANILIVNYMRRLKYENQTIEMQSGGKVMNYWINYSIKIERDKKLNYRKLLLSPYPKKPDIIILSKLTEYGFE